MPAEDVHGDTDALIVTIVIITSARKAAAGPRVEYNLHANVRLAIFPLAIFPGRPA